MKRTLAGTGLGRCRSSINGGYGSGSTFPLRWNITRDAGLGLKRSPAVRVDLIQVKPRYRNLTASDRYKLVGYSRLKRTYSTQQQAPLPTSLEQSGMEKLQKGWFDKIFDAKNLVHVSSCLSLSAFMVTDILWLRILSICSSFFFISFNYFYIKPRLWLSIKWSCVFITINTIQILLILYDRKSVNFDERERELYDSVFSRIFTEVEFRKLLRAAEWVTFEKGQEIVKQGEKTENIYLISNGVCVVEQQSTQSRLSLNRVDIKDEECQRPVVPASDPIQEEKDQLNPLKKKERKALLSKEEEEKLQYKTVGFMKDGELIGEFELIQSQYSPQRDMFQGTMNVVTPSSTVRAVEETKCLRWTQDGLNSMLLRNPTMKVGWNAFISYSLMSKLEEQRILSKEKNYLVFLFGILVDGIVNKDEKEAVKRYRGQNGVSKEMHMKVLQELGWTAEDYKRGFLSKFQERKNIEEFRKRKEETQNDTNPTQPNNNNGTSENKDGNGNNGDNK